MIGRAFRRPGLILLGCAIALLGAFAIRAVVGSGPARVSQVPATLPSSGVNVNGEIILKPVGSPIDGALSKTAAIAAARRAAPSKRTFPATAFEANITVPNSNLTDVPAWVVTFTRADPVSVEKHLVRHFTLVLNPATGKSMFGFFTE